MQRKPFILLMLLTMSAASRAATDDFDSFMGVGWVWILALSLYAVFGGILVVALCKTAAASDAMEEETYEAILKQARAPQGLSDVDSRIAGRWSPRPNRLDLNLADFAPQFLDIHISDEIVVRVDDVVAPEVGERTPDCASQRRPPTEGYRAAKVRRVRVTRSPADASADLSLQ